MNLSSLIIYERRNSEESSKEEETKCHYCLCKGRELEAECLHQGKPSCINCAFKLNLQKSSKKKSKKKFLNQFLSSLPYKIAPKVIKRKKGTPRHSSNPKQSLTKFKTETKESNLLRDLDLKEATLDSKTQTYEKAKSQSNLQNCKSLSPLPFEAISKEKKPKFTKSTNPIINEEFSEAIKKWLPANRLNFMKTSIPQRDKKMSNVIKLLSEGLNKISLENKQPKNPEAKEPGKSTEESKKTGTQKETQTLKDLLNLKRKDLLNLTKHTDKIREKEIEHQIEAERESQLTSLNLFTQFNKLLKKAYSNKKHFRLSKKEMANMLKENAFSAPTFSTLAKNLNKKYEINMEIKSKISQFLNQLVFEDNKHKFKDCLIYEGRRRKIRGEKMHQKCDDQGSLVIIFKIKKLRSRCGSQLRKQQEDCDLIRIGCFTSIGWVKDLSYVRDRNSGFFIIFNNQVKIFQFRTDYVNSIINGVSFGIGGKDFLYDTHYQSKSNIYLSQTLLGDNYQPIRHTLENKLQWKHNVHKLSIYKDIF